MPSDFHKAPKAWAQVKHSILGNYLSLFLGKLGVSGKPVYYVDGFAGPGRLEDGSKGSRSSPPSWPFRLLRKAVREFSNASTLKKHQKLSPIWRRPPLTT
jgi:hypothetical protein